VSPDIQDRIVVVLVRARNSNNIGAAARAMHDFGFRHLRIVMEYAPPLETARSAVDASKILAEAKTFASVAEAVADCTLVVGTTAVGSRALEHRLELLAQAGQKIHTEVANPASRVAILFGSEKTGLSNEELSHCHWVLTIPMYEHEEMRHPSMNLGQAVAVCLYELVRNPEQTSNVGLREAARAEDVERFLALFREVLEQTGYMQRYPANARETQLRQLVLRMGLTAEDMPVWMGVMRQMLWKIRQADDRNVQG
jgi:TrmH family RNA methyltransferase